MLLVFELQLQAWGVEGSFNMGGETVLSGRTRPNPPTPSPACFSSSADSPVLGKFLWQIKLKQKSLAEVFFWQIEPLVQPNWQCKVF